MVLTVAAVAASLTLGAKSIPLATVVDSLSAYQPDDTGHLIVRELRVPRTMLGLVVGAALGTSGALLQGVTRNPLADPGILGVNAGASFAVVCAIWAFGFTSVHALVWFAFIGAAAASAVVYMLGSTGRSGATPVRLALAGFALSMLLFALTRGVTLIDQNTLDQFRFWAVGSLTGRDTALTGAMLPFVALGLALAVGVSRPLNTLALGDETAASLGSNVVVVRAVATAAITLLCGAAVAAAGPIAFVGLVIPHLVRFGFGADQRWLIPTSALAGAAFLVISDTVGRLIALPSEVQVGIVTALIGGPTFVVLARQARMVQT